MTQRTLINFERYDVHKSGKKVPIYKQQTKYLSKEDVVAEKTAREELIRKFQEKYGQAVAK